MISFPSNLIKGVLPVPLKRRVRLRNKRRNADLDIYKSSRMLFCDPQRFLGHRNNRLYIFIFFCWQADHEIEFYVVPSFFEKRLQGFFIIILRKIFINNLSKSLAA